MNNWKEILRHKRTNYDIYFSGIIGVLLGAAVFSLLVKTHIHILSLLNNTFIGTLFAGMLLALVGLLLYRFQKNVDLVYQEEFKIRELAASLYSTLVTIQKQYDSLLNAYSSEKGLRGFLDALNTKAPGAFQTRMEKILEELNSKMEINLDDLIGSLKIKNSKNINIQFLLDKVTGLNIYILGAMIIPKSTEEQIKGYRLAFAESVHAVQTELRKVLGN